MLLLQNNAVRHLFRFDSYSPGAFVAFFGNVQALKTANKIKKKVSNKIITYLRRVIKIMN
jgi:hypothetical protein